MTSLLVQVFLDASQSSLEEAKCYEDTIQQDCQHLINACMKKSPDELLSNLFHMYVNNNKYKPFTPAIYSSELVQRVADACEYKLTQNKKFKNLNFIEEISTIVNTLTLDDTDFIICVINFCLETNKKNVVIGEQFLKFRYTLPSENYNLRAIMLFLKYNGYKIHLAGESLQIDLSEQ